ncbi:hypothetical protein [Raineyella sp. LH-20]|uniref:hypothetical protein n=1 Tax=Raineyella sp. LH-20 TaxID=3081204 RepID=UPI002953A5F3|nr:hypothetical protein [Raineyella sp. LH-20]WOP17826.1 hypothetical protein R0146_11270 [Raineyella sp. LH-20]
MSAPRNAFLQVLYSVFLGLMLVAFVGVGVNTFYPGPPIPSMDGQAVQDAYQRSQAVWALNTSIILVVCATVIMVLSLVRSDRLPVLSNGILLGGVFTMVYSVIMTLQGRQSGLRFAVVGVALLVTLLVGYLFFVRGRQRRAAVEEGAVEGAVAGGAPSGVLEARLAALEHRFEAMGAAWRDDRPGPA